MKIPLIFFLAFFLVAVASRGGSSRRRHANKLQLFERWLMDNGATFPKLELRDRGNDDRAIMSKGEIKKGDIVFKMPKRLLMFREQSFTHPLIGPIEECDHVELLCTPLAMNLLIEWKKGESSFFAPWINILPETYDTMAINYGPTEHKLLQGSFLLEEIDRIRRSLSRDWAALCKCSPTFCEQFVREQYLWAMQTCMSRAFNFHFSEGSDTGFSPMDIPNHMNEPEMIEFGTDDRQGFIYFANFDVPVGIEVFTSYGKRCNSHFMTDYGFALTDNPGNTAKFNILVPESVSSYWTKLRLLNPTNATASLSRVFFPEANYSNAAAKAMFGFARLAVADEEDFKALSLLSSFRLPDGEEDDENSQEVVPPVSLRNEQKAWMLILSTVKRSLANFSTTIEEDDGLLRSKLSLKHRFCIIQRRGEKLVYQYYLSLFDKISSFFNKQSWLDVLRSIQQLKLSACHTLAQSLSSPSNPSKQLLSLGDANYFQTVLYPLLRRHFSAQIISLARWFARTCSVSLKSRWPEDINQLRC